jgi:glycosyltransferase family protein
MDIRRAPLLKIPRKILKHILGVLYYPVLIMYGKPKVLSMEQTVETIITEKASISRFGDGEISMLLDKASYPFQKYDENLVAIYKDILTSNYDNFLVGLPIGYYSLENLNSSSSLMWRAHIALTWPRLKKLIKKDKIYYNANITRPYIGRKDTSNISNYFDRIKDIWHKRDIILIEGHQSRLGVGNDLFESANSVKRILCPSENAFSKFEEILKSTEIIDKNCLILIALGPTATALAFEIYKLGFQVLDIGNIDLEYEWSKIGVKRPVKIKGKYVSEAKGGRLVDDITDIEYNNQIIKTLV